MKKKCVPLSPSTQASVCVYWPLVRGKSERLSGKTTLPWESDIHTETVLVGVTIAVMKQKSNLGGTGFI